MFYLRYDFLPLIENLFISKADNSIPKLLKVMRTLIILYHLMRLKVILPIHLDNQFILQTYEVYNVITYDMLPAELTSDLFTPEIQPQQSLCISRMLPVSDSILLQKVILIIICSLIDIHKLTLSALKP